jgi:hypothetical protein
MRPALRALARAVGLLVIASCREESAIPPERLHLELLCDAREVEFGSPFELRCVRRHARGLAPEAFDPRSLAPLVVEERARTVREDAVTREEVIVLEARAFALEKIVLGPIVWRAVVSSSGEELVARSARTEIAVRSSLRPTDGPEPELPFAPRKPRALWPAWLAGGAVVLALGAFAALRLRRARPAQPAPLAAAPSEPLHERLARELAALAERGAEAEADRSAAARFATELARLVRASLATRGEVPAEVLTSAELATRLAAHAGTSEAERRALEALLRRCEWIQFARAGLRAGEASELIGAAERFVAALRPREELAS